MCIELGVEVTYPATEGVVTGKEGERERGRERGGVRVGEFYQCALNWELKLLTLPQREL